MDMIRKSAHPVDPLFTNRWSPRAFDAQPMPEEDILSMLEAARWAPSAYNIQPWRFVYIQREDSQWPDYVGLLDEFNAAWAKEASALIFLLSDKLVDREGETEPRPSNYHSFDAGAAWAQLALQATQMGYSAHAMAGVLFDKAQAQLNAPDRFKLEIAIAVGKRSDPSDLPKHLQQMESPSQRKDFDEIAFKKGLPNV
ncbi:nitroreductase family protein [Terasakiella sp. A23]|uniref:nitroreductase family protein n=1 Tax=Terasakiella sp. FCG-A23 TaxID=3080561 RepID=UPI0029557C3F|nr:nitroreductase family protein [Terasakiella sp. A23]MDV7340491.1 nitroreductase family protein [Terasakiella sp. A23]